VVRFGDVEGTVEDVRVRDTVIRMYDGRQVFVPNANIFTASVINNNRNRRRRLDFEVNIAYPEDASAAMATAVEALAGIEGILGEPSPLAVVESLGESSLVMRVYFWVDPVCTSILEVKSAAIAAVKRALEKAGIEIPSPVLTIKPAGQ
jgi:small-conductance mechanosensitive channel